MGLSCWRVATTSAVAGTMIVFGLITSPAHAQCVAGLTNPSGGSGFNGIVAAAVSFDADAAGPEPAAFYAGGSFTSVDGLAISYIARWDGVQWSAVGGGLDGAVRALLVYDDDGAGPNLPALYVAGAFTTAGGIVVNRVARWDGADWSAVGFGFDGAVQSLGSFDVDGPGLLPPTLVASGYFYKTGLIPLRRLAQWNGLEWLPMGTGSNGVAYAMTVYDDDGGGPHAPALILGGAMTETNGVSTNSAARWDGLTWSGLGTGLNSAIFSMAVWDDDGDGPNAGQLYCGGQFTTAAGLPANYVARWDGSNWSAFPSEPNGSIFTLAAADPDGAGPLGSCLFVGGVTSRFGTQPIARLARWDGAAWWPAGNGLNGVMYSMALHDEDGDGPNPAALFVGGDFTTAGGTTMNRLARLDYAPHVMCPPRVSVDPGGSASITATVSGTGPFGYQWYRGAAPLTDDGTTGGTTTATLSISPAAGAHAGDYHVVVTNACASTTGPTTSLVVMSRDWATSDIRIVVPQMVTMSNPAGTGGRYYHVDPEYPQYSRILYSPAFASYVYTPGDVMYVTGGSVADGAKRPFLILGKTAATRVQIGSKLSGNELWYIEGKLQRQLSAETLQSYLLESLPVGRQVTIGTTPDATAINIYLGTSTYTNGRIDFNAPDAIDIDGFILKRVDESNFIIAGPSEEGTENGVYEFLEQFFDVRWLWPDCAFTAADLASVIPGVGEPNYVPDLNVRGDYVERHPSVRVQLGEQRHTPWYLTRWGTGFGSSSKGLVSVHAKWGRRMRRDLRVEAGHNITNLFPSSKYATLYPDIYPQYRPGHVGDANYALQPYTSLSTASWNPNFSSSNLVTAGVSEVDSYFAENPQASYISLTLQDGGVNDERDSSYARDPAPTNPPNLLSMNSVHSRNLSWSFFTWANAVAGQVQSQGKYLGALAYHECYEPPLTAPRSGQAPFGSAKKIASNIVVFTGYERLRLLDAGQRTAYQTWIDKWWSVLSGSMGAHDYLFDSVTPVLPLTAMQEYIADDAARNIRHSRAEMHLNWGDAFRYYAHFKLLWNPDLDVMGPGGMLDDWCTKMVGPAAAPALISYHRQWDNYWSIDPTGAKALAAIREANGSFATWQMAEQMDNENVVYLLATSRDLLNSCVTSAMGDPLASVDQRNRAKVLRAQFEYWNLTGIARMSSTKAHSMPMMTNGSPDPAKVGAATKALLDGIAAEQARFNFARNHPQGNDYGNSHVLGVPDGVPPRNQVTDAQGKRWSEDMMIRLLGFRDDPVVGPDIRRMVGNLNADPSLNPHLNTELTRIRAIWLHLANKGQPPVAVNQNLDPGFTTTTLSSDPWKIRYSGVPFSLVADPVTGTGRVVRVAGPTAGVETETQPAICPEINAPLNGGAVASGEYVALFRVYTPINRTGTGYLTLFAQFVNSAQVPVANFREQRVFSVPGEWATVPYFITVPTGVGATHVQLMVFTNNLTAGQEIYFDDYLLYKVPESAPFVGAVVAGANAVTVSGINTDAKKVSILVNGVAVASAQPATTTLSCCLPPANTITSVRISLPAGQTLQAGQVVTARVVPSDIPDRNWDSRPATVPNGVSGDLDGDGDVDDTDVATLRACSSRAGVRVSAACTASDLDQDGDSDSSDFGLLQVCYSGASRLVTNASCLR